MDSLTASYKVNKLEVKMEGVTHDGRKVQEVLTIGGKRITPVSRRLPADPLMDTGRLMRGRN